MNHRHGSAVGHTWGLTLVHAGDRPAYRLVTQRPPLTVVTAPAQFDVAKAHGCEVRLRAGLAKTPIASVGHVVSEELQSHGFAPSIFPANESYFMKPLISAIAAALGRHPPRGGALD